MRGDRPFAYDLVIEYGAVSGRVVLLLRSAEAKPRFFTSVFRIKTPHPGLLFGRPGEGDKTNFEHCLLPGNGPATTRSLSLEGV
jgi:hypothetical protein